MTIAEKMLKNIANALAVIACVMIIIMMLMAVTDVVLRIVFSSPIIGATEIIQILNVGIVVGLGAGTIKNQHVTVNFITDKLPRVPKFTVLLIADILNMGILGLLSFCSVRMMLKSQVQGYTYSLLRIPEWPFVGLIALGLFGGMLATIFVMIQRIREHRNFQKITPELQMSESQIASSVQKEESAVKSAGKEQEK